jgi:hypothetical protein
MKTREITLKGIAEELGSAMMIGWTMLLGPLGAIPLLTLAYSIFTQNLALGVICGLLVFAPLMLTVAWGPFAWAAGCVEAGVEERTAPLCQLLPQRNRKAA